MKWQSIRQSSPATDISTLSWGLSLFVSRRGLHFFITTFSTRGNLLAEVVKIRANFSH